MPSPESDVPILEPIGKDPRVTPHLPAIVEKPVQAREPAATSDTDSYWPHLREDDPVFGDTRIARLNPVLQVNVHGRIVQIGITIPRGQGDVDTIMAEIARMLGAEIPY